MSNFAAKSKFRRSNRHYTSKFGKKVDLAYLKLDVDKLHIDKLEIAPLDLSKPSNVIKNDDVKKSIW